MKISRSIRELYDKQKELNDRLAERVKLLFVDRKEENWFYRGRVKGLESFAQKLETGRHSINALEDFFACTLVVETRKDIKKAKRFVEKWCTIQYQRPVADDITYNQPYEFQFDDLRLYVKLKPLDSAPPSPIDDILFEVQIKTLLQHAWAIATHDLIYKAGSISWGAQKLAYQIKAMLEHAEISIEMTEDISKSSALVRKHKDTKAQMELITWLKETWSSEFLPTDVRRLANTLGTILTAFKLELSTLKEVVSLDTAAGFGVRAMNLSPYEAIVKALFNHRRNEFDNFLQNHSFTKIKLLITPEMELELNSQSERLIYVNNRKIL